MAMDFYLKDLYPGSGYSQTTETTVPDSSDKQEIVENAEAAKIADKNAGNTVGGKAIIGCVLIVVCLAVFLGVKK